MFGKKPALSSGHSLRGEKTTAVISKHRFFRTRKRQQRPLQFPRQLLPLSKEPASQDSAMVRNFTDSSLVTTPAFCACQRYAGRRDLLEQINFEALDRIPKEARKARISNTVDTLIKSVSAPLTAAQTALSLKPIC